MESNKCSCGCNCKADEKWNKLKQIVNKNKDNKGALIQVLHETQELYGYLPKNILNLISEEMGISLAEIYGVATFYTQFSLKPKGKYRISLCLGTACYVKGAAKNLEKLKEKLGIDVGECTKDGKFSLDVCRCIGACGLAPVMVINDKVYGNLVPERIDEILEGYKED